MPASWFSSFLFSWSSLFPPYSLSFPPFPPFPPPVSLPLLSWFALSTSRRFSPPLLVVSPLFSSFPPPSSRRFPLPLLIVCRSSSPLFLSSFPPSSLSFPPSLLSFPPFPFSFPPHRCRLASLRQLYSRFLLLIHSHHLLHLPLLPLSSLSPLVVIDSPLLLLLVVDSLHRPPTSWVLPHASPSTIPPSSEYEPAHIPSERGGAGSFHACWSVVGWAHIPQQRGGAPSRVGARVWRW